MTDFGKALADRFDAKRADGLVDVKFYIANRDEASFDKVCGEVLALYDAVGDARELEFGDDLRA